MISLSIFALKHYVAYGIIYEKNLPNVLWSNLALLKVVVNKCNSIIEPRCPDKCTAGQKCLTSSECAPGYGCMTAINNDMLKICCEGKNDNSLKRYFLNLKASLRQ